MKTYLMVEWLDCGGGTMNGEIFTTPVQGEDIRALATTLTLREIDKVMGEVTGQPDWCVEAFTYPEADPLLDLIMESELHDPEVFYPRWDAGWAISLQRILDRTGYRLAGFPPLSYIGYESDGQLWVIERDRDDAVTPWDVTHVEIIHEEVVITDGVMTLGVVGRT
jgi:hypothetical protein